MSNLLFKMVPDLATNFSAQKAKVRHRRPTAHARTRYRCFLPDLAGLAGRRRVGPMSDLSNSNIPHCAPSCEAEFFAAETTNFCCSDAGDLRLHSALHHLPFHHGGLENGGRHAGNSRQNTLRARRRYKAGPQPLCLRISHAGCRFRHGCGHRPARPSLGRKCHGCFTLARLSAAHSHSCDFERTLEYPPCFS